jgi:hypothetical protein
MRTVVALAVGALAVGAAATAAAQELKAPPFFNQTPRSAKPPKVDWNWRPAVEQADTARPSVVCGMTVVPGDPKVDPKMAATPHDTRTKYTLKVAEPTVCKPQQR